VAAQLTEGVKGCFIKKGSMKMVKFTPLTPSVSYAATFHSEGFFYAILI
jgi:hypothetical protein